MEGPPPIPQTLRGLWPHTPKSLGLPGPDPGAFGRSPPNPLEVGLPAPHPGLLFRRRKSNQKAAQGRDPFDGVPPLCIPPPRRHKGGRMPPFGNPRISLQPLCSTVEAPRRTVRGRIQRGGPSPLIGRCGGWSLGGGHSRKCPPPMRAFGYFSHERKVTQGTGLKAPYIIQ